MPDRSNPLTRFPAVERSWRFKACAAAAVAIIAGTVGCAQQPERSSGAAAAPASTCLLYTF
jgi:hypothetical protein